MKRKLIHGFMCLALSLQLANAQHAHCFGGAIANTNGNRTCGQCQNDVTTYTYGSCVNIGRSHCDEQSGRLSRTETAYNCAGSGFLATVACTALAVGCGVAVGSCCGSILTWACLACIGVGTACACAVGECLCNCSLDATGGGPYHHEFNGSGCTPNGWGGPS